MVMLTGLVAVGCRPATPIETPEPPPAEPVAQVEPLVSELDEATAAKEPVEEEGYVVTLASRCEQQWTVLLIRGDSEEEVPSSDAEPGEFQLGDATTHQLRLHPGDAVLLTTPYGGMLDLRFDEIYEGFVERVEVNSECTGVKRTRIPEEIALNRGS